MSQSPQSPKPPQAPPESGLKTQKTDENKASNENKLLATYDLHKHFPIRGGLLRRQIGAVQALNGVSLNLEKNRIVSLVGESGCGKTTFGRVITGLYEATAGSMLFDAPPEIYTEFEQLWAAEQKSTPSPRLNEIRSEYELSNLSKQKLRQRHRELQMVFQDPYGSLNPRFTVKDIVAEGLRIHKIFDTKREERQLVESLLERTGIDPSLIHRYPHEFSGGQRQRLGIARVLALKPKLVVLDEPVSALDVSVQVQILELFNQLKEEFQLTYLFIAHDLSVVDYFTDDIAVMYLGSIVEQGHKTQVNQSPLHPYTEALISAVPLRDPSKRRTRIYLEGDVPSPSNMPSGCPFHNRCPKLKNAANPELTKRCQTEKPLLQPINPESQHLVACHLYR